MNFRGFKASHLVDGFVQRVQYLFYTLNPARISAPLRLQAAEHEPGNQCVQSCDSKIRETISKGKDDMTAR